MTAPTLTRAANALIPSGQGRLDFHARVLTLAADPARGLAERLKFAAILAGNLDEFAARDLARESTRGDATLGDSTLGEKFQQLADAHQRLWDNDLSAELARATGHTVITWAQTTAAERLDLTHDFHERLSPQLTPRLVDNLRPLPITAAPAVAAHLTDPDDPHVPRLAAVTLPPSVPRLIALPGQRLLPTEQLVGAHLGTLFSGMRIHAWVPFRVVYAHPEPLEVTRPGPLLDALRHQLTHRRALPIRTCVGQLHCLDATLLWEIAALVPPRARRTRSHPALAEDPFARLREGDVLLHHPYDRFDTSVGALLERAADDPQVRTIKQTLYRTDAESVTTLLRAVRNGKQVTALIEVTARGDERANLDWAHALAEAGAQVSYGVPGLKTHCKITVITRDEETLRTYAHLSTGNYHRHTAREYEDLGILTTDPELTADLHELFHALTGHSRQTGYRRLLVAPHGIRSGLLERIEAQSHPEGLIQLKVNALTDPELIGALQTASRAGARLELLVRGACGLIPDERIRVRSMLGDHLEHSRIYRFGTETWIGSADLAPRNLDRRVETLARITDPAATAWLTRLFEIAFSPGTSGFDLAIDGTWSRTPGVDFQSLVTSEILTEDRRSNFRTLH